MPVPITGLDLAVFAVFAPAGMLIYQFVQA